MPDESLNARPHMLRVILDEYQFHIAVECPHDDLGIGRPCAQMIENQEPRPVPPTSGIEPLLRGGRWVIEEDGVEVEVPDSDPWIVYFGAEDDYEDWVPDPGPDGKGVCWPRATVDVGEWTHEGLFEGFQAVEIASLPVVARNHGEVDEADLRIALWDGPIEGEPIEASLRRVLGQLRRQWATELATAKRQYLALHRKVEEARRLLVAAAGQADESRVAGVCERSAVMLAAALDTTVRLTW